MRVRTPALFRRCGVLSATQFGAIVLLRSLRGFLTLSGRPYWVRARPLPRPRRHRTHQCDNNKIEG